MSTESYFPKWHKEMDIFTRIKPLIILEGNVFDSYSYPFDGSTKKGAIMRLPEYLHYYFKDIGYTSIVFYDSIRGFYNHYENDYIERFAGIVKAIVDNGSVRADFASRGTPASTISTALSQTTTPCVIVMDFASRYISSLSNMTQEEVNSYTVLLQAAMEGRDARAEQGTLKNLLILIVNKVNDIPAWFYLDNPNEKTITIGTPSKEERAQMLQGNMIAGFFAGDVYREDSPYYKEHPEELEKIKDRFVAITEGFGLSETNGLRRLCKNERR